MLAGHILGVLRLTLASFLPLGFRSGLGRFKGTHSSRVAGDRLNQREPLAALETVERQASHMRSASLKLTGHWSATRCFSLKATLFGRPSTDNGRPTYRDGSGNAADRPKSLHIALHGAGTRRPFGEMPPILNGQAPPEIAAAMRRVIQDPDDSAGIGSAAQDWFRRRHSTERIVELQVAAYARVLGPAEPAVLSYE